MEKLGIGATSFDRMLETTTQESQVDRKWVASVDLSRNYRDLSVQDQIAFGEFVRARRGVQHNIQSPLILKLPLEIRKMVFDRVSLKPSR